MRRTEVLQGVRQMRFSEIYERSRSRRLSYLEAAATLGMSEWSFRRLRGRYEAEGEAGLLDRRLGKVSPTGSRRTRLSGWYRFTGIAMRVGR